MLAKLSRIRVSSVTRILPPRVSTGTLKSTRINTRLPRTSRSRKQSLAISPTPARDQSKFSCFDHEQEHEQDTLFPQHFHQFHAAVAVAPLVVVPTDYFRETVSKHER